MSKPATLPEWNSVEFGDTDFNVEPVTQLKEEGWSPGDHPNSQNLNWLFYWIYAWILWLDSILTDTEKARVVPAAVSGPWGSNYTGLGYSGTSVTPSAVTMLPSRDGWRITSVRARMTQGDTTAGRVVMTMNYADDAGGSGGTVTTPSGTAISAGTAAFQNISITESNDDAMLDGSQAGRCYSVQFAGDGVAVARVIYLLEVTYERI